MTFLLALLVFVLIMTAMSVGVIFGRAADQGILWRTRCGGNQPRLRNLWR